MKRTLLSLALASIFAMGCGRAALPTQAAAPAAEKAAVKEAPVVESSEEAASAAKDEVAPKDEAAPAKGGRAPGDYVVYRFSGSFRKAPLTLTQRVIAKEGATLTVEIAAIEGSAKRVMQVKINEASATKNDVVSAAWIEGGAGKAATVEAYEQLMAETVLAADENEARLGDEEATVTVGGAALPCHKTSYRVRIGKKQATMRTLESEAFPWGDLGGEIVAANGSVLYRAEIVEVGSAEKATGKASAGAVAHSDLDL